MGDFLPALERFFLSVKEAVPPVFYAPALALTLVAVLWLAKRLVLHRLRRWASKTQTHWDDVFIDAISFPANFLILASGIVFLTNLLPLPERVDHFATMALQGCVIVSIVMLVDRLIRAVLEGPSARVAFGQVSHGAVKGLLRGFVIGMGALIFLDLIGISITPILASLGIGSLAVALALQDTLANFFAGVYVAVDQPVRVGDFVRLESGQEGYVIDVGWRSTRIRMLPNNVVIIPNTKLMGSVITNFYLPDKELAVLVDVGVHYDSDLKRVEEVTVDTARQVLRTVPGAVDTFDPFIRYHTFGESSINFTVILRAREFVDNYLLKHEFIKALHARYRREGITIPYPLRTLEISPDSSKRLQQIFSSTSK